jgi:hypothetical protein
MVINISSSRVIMDTYIPTYIHTSCLVDTSRRTGAYDWREMVLPFFDRLSQAHGTTTATATATPITVPIAGR